MKNRKNQLIILVVFTSILLSACQAGQVKEEPEAQEIILPLGLIAEGTFEPVSSVELAFGSSGIVSQVLIQEGKKIQTGDAIARLVACDMIDADIANAKADQTASQQELADLELYADFARAQALQELIDAQEAFDEAQLDWDEYDIDNYEEDLGDAQEDVRDAQDDLEEAISDLDAYLDLAEDNPTRERYQDAVDDAENDLHRAEQDLNDVENDYLQAKHNYDLAAAQLVFTQKEYDRKLEGPDKDELSQLQSRITALESVVTGLEGSLLSCQITTPIDGTLLFNDLVEGEFAQSGNVRVMVADMDRWQLVTDDVSEYDVVTIQEGQVVKIFVDALPAISLDGIIESIDQVPTLDHGDVTYTVTILISDAPPELRWGMTGSVDFFQAEQ